MANNYDNFSFDDDDFSSDYWDDTGSGGFSSNKKQTKARQALTEFGGSFISGVKNRLLDPNAQRRMLYKNLPEGFTAAHDALTTSKNMFQDIAYEAKTELRTAGEELSESSRTLAKGYSKYLPKSLRDKVHRKLEETEGHTYYTPTEEESFGSELDEIMKDSAKFQRTALAITEDTQVKTSSKVVAAQVTTTAAISITNKLLQSAVRNSDKLTAINFAETKIARKNAEISFKTHVLQRKQLDVLEQSQEMMRKAFEELVKNTGLPEAVKITKWERTSATIQNKLVGLATGRVTKSFSGIASTVAENFKKKMTDNIRTGSGMAGMILSGLVGEMQAAQDGMGESTATKAGNMVGNLGMMGAEHLFSKKFSKQLKADPRLQAQGDRVLNFMDGAVANLGRSMKGFGRIGELAQFLGFTPEMLSSDQNKRDLVRASGLGNLEEVTSWNKRNDIALTEVIPGQLGMIHQTLEIMRTGDADTPLKRYDYEKGMFSTNADIMHNVKDRMFKQSGVRATQKDVAKLLNIVDPNKAVKPADRKILARYLMETAHDESGFIDAQALMHPDHSPIAKFDIKAAERIAEALSTNSPLAGGFNPEWDNLTDKDIFTANMHGDDTFHSSLQSANKQLKDLRTRMPNYHKSAIDFTHSGYHDLLAQEGLIKWNDDQKQWNINNDAFFDQVFGGQGGGKGPAKPPSPNSPKGPNKGGLPYGGMMGGYSPPTGPQGPVGGSGGDVLPVQRNDFKETDTGAYSSFQMELLETLERVSSKPAADVGNQLLEAIRERLEMGIPTGGPAMDNPTAQNKKTKWYRKLLEGSSKIGRGAKGYFKFSALTLPSAIFNNFVKNPLKLMGGITDLPGKILRSGKNGAKVIMANSKEFANQMGDIYVKGKDAAAIKAKDLLNGDYFDAASGKVIQSFKDIKGPIKDKTGQIVVSAEEYAKGIYTVIDGKRKSIVAGALKAFGSFTGKALGLQARVMAAPAKLVGKVADLAKDYLKDKLAGVTDIFVAGEKNARLIGSVLKAGGYFNRDGTVIRKLSDIKGDVVDASNQTILTIHEMAKGLVDSKGARIKTGLAKLWSMVAKPANMIKRHIANSFKAVKAVALAPFNLMSKASKGIFNAVKRQKNVDTDTLISARSADRLDEIYKLLDQRLEKPKGSWFDTDGSGHRDGSREDVLAKRKGPVEKVVEATKKDGGRKGILGMLMSLVGGVGGIFGALKGWMGGLYSVMRAGALTKLATSVMGLVTLFASKGKAKGAVKAGAKLGALAKAGKFAGKHWGKIALGTGALLMTTKQASASDMFKGAMNTLSGSDEAAYKEAVATARAIDGDDGDSLDFGNERNDDEKQSFFNKLTNGATDGGLGTILAMAGAGGLTGLFSKGKTVAGGAAKAASPGMMGRIGSLLAKGGSKGKAAAAALTAAGGLGGKAAMAAPKFVPVAPVAGGGALAAGKAGMGAVAPTLATAGKSAMAAAPSVAGAVGKEAAKKGLGSMAMGGLKSIGRNAGLLGAGFAAYDAYTTEGTMVDKGLAFGKSMLTTAAMGKAFSLGKMAMSTVGRQALMQGGRTALMALGGALSTPVVIGALAVGALAVGGYFAYKYFFGKDKNALARYRMAQYGIDLDNKDQASIIIRFEGLCQKNVEMRGDKANFTRNMTPTEVMKIFGISPKDKERMEAFIAWFNNRFKPVFLNDFAAYYNQTRRKDMEKADTELKKEEKLKLLDAFAGVDKAAYDCLISPFPGGKLLKYTAKKVASAYETAKRKIGHEKDTKKDVKDAKESKDKPYNPATATAAERFANGEYGKQRTEDNKTKSSSWWGDPEKAKQHVDSQQGFFSRIGNAFRDLGHSMDTGLAAMSGDQKQWQMAVYKGCKNAGFSEQQARIMTAEIGRENSYNPKYLFGGHADPHKGSNLGMISWQGDRRTKLIGFLAKAGALDKSGNIIPSQAAIDAQANFMMWEMRNTHKKAGNAFLSNPNISYAEGVKILGMDYIKWRFTDPKYAAGHKNRDQFYNMLLKQLNAKDGDGVDPTAQSSTPDSANANDGFDVKAAVKDSMSSTGSTSSGSAGGGGGWFGYMNGGGSVSQSNAENLKSFGGGALGTAAAGFEGVIPATVVAGGVPTSHRAYKAGMIATKRAHKDSQKKCASYVATALLEAGYKFERQPSAYMYANGTLSGAGFSKIGTNSKHQIGDVMVWPAHGVGPSSGGGTHGHIQIFNGTSWVSDFIQKSMVPGNNYKRVSPTLWRDNTLLGKAGAEAEKTKPSDSTAEGSKVDDKAKKAAIPNTVAKPQTSTATPKDTKASTQIPSVLARPQANTSSFVGGTPTNSFIPVSSRSAIQERDAFPVQQPVAQVIPQPTIDPGIQRVSKIVERSTSSLLGTKAVQATQQRERATAVSKEDELVSIGKQQLEVQTNMLKHLAEISLNIKNLSGAPDKKPEEQSTSGSVAAAQAMRGKGKTVPVSMAAKH